MSDLDHMLDHLPEPAASPPPPAFLAAVARRRWARRANAAGVVAVAAVAAAGLFAFLTPRPVPPAEPVGLVERSAPPESAIVLTRLNADRPPEDLLLPEPDSAATSPDEPLRMGVRIEPAQIDRWMRQ